MTRVAIFVANVPDVIISVKYVELFFYLLVANVPDVFICQIDLFFYLLVANVPDVFICQIDLFFYLLFGLLPTHVQNVSISVSRSPPATEEIGSNLARV
jgi:hypothetical protein